MATFKPGDNVLHIQDSRPYVIKAVHEHNGREYLTFRYQQKEHWFDARYYVLRSP